MERDNPPGEKRKSAHSRQINHGDDFAKTGMAPRRYSPAADRRYRRRARPPATSVVGRCSASANTGIGAAQPFIYSAPPEHPGRPDRVCPSYRTATFPPRPRVQPVRAGMGKFRRRRATRRTVSRPAAHVLPLTRIELFLCAIIPLKEQNYLIFIIAFFDYYDAPKVAGVWLIQQ